MNWNEVEIREAKTNVKSDRYLACEFHENA